MEKITQLISTLEVRGWESPTTTGCYVWPDAFGTLGIKAPTGFPIADSPIVRKGDWVVIAQAYTDETCNYTTWEDQLWGRMSPDGVEVKFVRHIAHNPGSYAGDFSFEYQEETI